MHITFDRSAARVIDRGRDAWRNLRPDESWEKWIIIGRGIDVGRTTIMRHLGTNLPTGRTWATVFGQWLKETEFGEIDKSTRSRLQICIDNLSGIESWRATLPLKRRLELNHPNSVLRHWKAATMPMHRKSTMFETAGAPNKIEDIGKAADNFVKTVGAHNAQRFIGALQTILAPLHRPAAPQR